jgi:hypothetical protein
MSWLFIRASNQQSDQDIAASLQFCDSRRDAITSMILELRFGSRLPASCHILVARTPQGGARRTATR